MNDPANAAAFSAYQKKMELTEQLTKYKQDVENAKSLALLVRVARGCQVGYTEEDETRAEEIGVDRRDGRRSSERAGGL